MIDWITEHLELSGFALFALIAFWQIRKRQKHSERAIKLVKKAQETKTDEPLTLHPEIDPAKCAGCATCVTACPEGEIIGLIDHKAALVAPTKCVGHGECERACPTGAITLVFGTKTRGMDIPRITSNYETNVPGLYIAGELGGMGLIRNAVKQGAAAAKHAIQNLSRVQEPTDTDILIVGAGPAGLSAALAATEAKKTYLCIDQNTLGGTVNQYPRQKVVMSHPAELPLVGQMKFSKNKVSKEELLGFWSQVIKKARLKINERTKFESLTQSGSIFKVKTSQGEYSAKKVILCMGVRGSPRKLGLPNEDLSKVTYQLIDPDQYVQKNIAIVGGGNAATEAAQMLAQDRLKNRVQLLVRGKTFDRCNPENQAAVEKLSEQGKLKIHFETTVAAISAAAITLSHGGSQSSIKNDYLFVFAGAEMPHQFLMSLGIAIDKKFGSALK